MSRSHIDRRGLLCGCLALGAAGGPPAFSAPGAGDAAQAVDMRHMGDAIALARGSGRKFAAILAVGEEQLAKGVNPGWKDGFPIDPVGHGEMIAIGDAVAAHGSRRLAAATLYTTAEPCAMCMAAVIWSRIRRVVYAVSIRDLQKVFDQIDITSAELAARAGFASVELVGGVLRDEALTLFDLAP